MNPAICAYSSTFSEGCRRVIISYMINTAWPPSSAGIGSMFITASIMDRNAVSCQKAAPVPYRREQAAHSYDASYAFIGSSFWIYQFFYLCPVAGYFFSGNLCPPAQGLEKAVFFFGYGEYPVAYQFIRLRQCPYPDDAFRRYFHSYEYRCVSAFDLEHRVASGK